MAQPKETLICVDFGMTGSVTLWRDNQPHKLWSPEKTKIPTTLAYDSKGTLITWGTPAKPPCDKFAECFKSYIASASIPSFPGAPTSKQELFRWIRDYITAICAQTAHNIDFYNDGWRHGDIIWNFTVPGCWSDPVIRDFDRLAKDAVFSCFESTEKIRIYTRLTEGEASALYLLNDAMVAKSHKFATGDIMISCDIGGATTDIAISSVLGAGKLRTWPQLTVYPVGLVSIDKNFWQLARQVLYDAGSQEHADIMAWELTRGEHFGVARKEFSGAAQKSRITIEFPLEWDIEDWPSEESEVHERMSIIKRQCLSIHRDVFESLFQDLAEQIEAAIDEAINAMSKVDRVPSIIGFCGGGSQTTYLMNRLRRRYEDVATVIDHRQLTIPPVMATVVGCSVVCDRTQLQEFVKETRFGIATKDELEWRAAEENKGDSSFSIVPSFEVCFSRSAHVKVGGSDFRTHKIIAAPADAISQKDILEVQVPNSQKWVVEVDLTNRRRGVISRKVKYEIVCRVLGRWNIEIEARSEQDGLSIPCKIVGGGGSWWR